MKSVSQLVVSIELAGKKIKVGAKKIIDEAATVISNWQQYGKENGVGKESIKLIQRDLKI